MTNIRKAAAICVVAGFALSAVAIGAQQPPQQPPPTPTAQTPAPGTTQEKTTTQQKTTTTTTTTSVDKYYAVGNAVTLTSCVEKGQRDNTFVLTKTADVPAHPATFGRVVYWLDSVKDLPPHVGHSVRVQGTVTEVKQGEMEVKSGADTAGGGWYVEIEGPGKDIHTSPDKAGVTTAGRDPGKNDVKTTLVKLKVSEVTMTAPTCTP